MSAGFENFGEVGGDMMAYASTGGVPWHGLGTALPGLATAAEMIEAAMQDWEVETRRLSFQSPDGTWIETDGYGVVRKDTEVPLGVVGKRYTPVQNRDLFSFFDEIVAQDAAIYETAGSLHGGKKVWVLAKLPEDEIIVRNGLDDITKHYILLANSHDGSQALNVYFTDVRVVCQNTLMASAWGAKNRVTIRHTKSAGDKLQDAATLMGFSTQYYEAMEAQRNFLADASISDFEEVLDYFTQVWPDTDAEKSRAHQKRSLALTCLTEEATRYGYDWLSALNAVTGVIDHDPKSITAGKEDMRMDKLLFGVGADLSNKAFDLALEYAKFPKNDKKKGI